MEPVIDLDAYLARTGLTAAPAPDAAGLAHLHAAHLAAIPFENLDVVAGRPIRLDLESLEAKLVAGRRGGYCFEHAALFHAVLDRLGFRSQLLMARVRLGAPPRDGGLTHALLRVETPSGAMLADTGFGMDGPWHPIPLLPDLVNHTPGAAHRLRQEAGQWVLEGDVGGDDFEDLYAFTLEPHPIADLEIASHWVATHPDSPFTRTLTVQRIAADRRLCLRGRVLEIHRADGIESRRIADLYALRVTIEREFGIALPADMALALPEPP
jgi:N-hydroxyarylamine O-acetyltransferase